MPILNIQVSLPGLSATNPNFCFIDTNDTFATVTAPGYLNGANAEQIGILTNKLFAFVSTIASAGSPATLQLLKVSAASGVYSLSAPANLHIQTVATTLNTADVLGAYAAPKLLLNAPGAGKTIFVLSMLLYTKVSTAFATGGVGIIQYDSTVNGGGTNALAATIAAANITAAASQIYNANGYATGTATAISGITNKGIYFSNQTGAFTAGSGSSLTIELQFIQLATP